jgi:hypothetical protein
MVNIHLGRGAGDDLRMPSIQMSRTPSKYPLVDGVPFAAALSPSLFCVA